MPPEKKKKSNSPIKSNVKKPGNFTNKDFSRTIQKASAQNKVEATATQNTDVDFQVVSYRKKKGPIFGTRPNSLKSIAGTPTLRTIDIFVGGLNPNLSVESLREYLLDVITLKPVEVRSNRVNNNNQSFLIKINASDKYKIFNADNWEQNVMVKPFRHPKNCFIENKNTSCIYSDWGVAAVEKDM